MFFPDFTNTTDSICFIEFDARITALTLFNFFFNIHKAITLFDIDALGEKLSAGEIKTNIEDEIGNIRNDN